MEIGVPSDEAMPESVERVALADPDAFARAYEHFRLPVYRYLRARVASDADALDLTASTFERAWTARHSFSPRGGGVGAWLLRIARNAAIDAHRREARRPQALPDEFQEGPASSDLDHVALVDAVTRLPETQRDAVWLRFAAGLSAREIGTVLGKSEAAVQKQIQRALEALGEALE